MMTKPSAIGKVLPRAGNQLNKFRSSDHGQPEFLEVWIGGSVEEANQGSSAAYFTRQTAPLCGRSTLGRVNH